MKGSLHILRDKSEDKEGSEERREINGTVLFFILLRFSR